ncbi:MAG: KEOPS complex kinase/ATPase Bud32, partial [Ignisphaera sp.]
IPLYIDDDAGLLIMSFIDGVSLRDSMDSLSIENVCEVCRKIGLYVAKLHKNSIVHGDITTSNILLEKDSKNVYIIDFGLTNFTSRLEDQAIDVHIFFRSIESTHHNFEDLAKKCFIEGYRQIRGDYTEKVLETVNNIRKMGRYVAERKIKSIWRT